MSKSDHHEIAGFHLNHKQYSALEKVYTHPVTHKLTWHEVETLLDAVGELEVKHNGSWHITIGGQPAVFHVNHGKELTTQQVMELRKMLSGAGLEIGS